MKTVLLIALVVYSVVAANVSNSPVTWMTVIKLCCGFISIFFFGLSIGQVRKDFFVLYESSWYQCRRVERIQREIGGKKSKKFYLIAVWIVFIRFSTFQDWPLTEEEQSFVCCMVGEASLVKDKSVNMLCVQRLFSQQSLDAGMNITKAVTECSSTGIESNNLVTCYQEATFFRCLFDKMQIQLSSIESNSECHIDWTLTSIVYNLEIK